MKIKQLFNPTIEPNSQWLFFLRVAIALLSFVHFAAIQPDFNNLMGFNGFVQPDILNVRTESYQLTVYKIFMYLHSLRPTIQYESVLSVFRYLYPTCLLLLAVGFCTRISALLSLLLHFVFINSIVLYQYGVDCFMTILLFYCCLCPVGKQNSVDNLIFKRRTTVSTNQYIYLIQVHICIAYFFSGLDKIVGINWRNGEAIWKAVNSYNELGLIDFTPFYNTPLFLIIGWATIIIEMCYPLFINIRKTREIWLALTIGLHLSIMLTMGLFFFSAVMIIFNLVAYYLPFVKEAEVKNSPKRYRELITNEL